MTENAESLVFVDNVQEQPGQAPWKVAIIDDDEQVHSVTKIALAGYTFQDRPLEFVCAFSGREGEALFAEHKDIAVCLLDVVMESATAGLDLIKHIRKNNNEFTRIVLRTGQPGQAPEADVIKMYDINDYKEKTELTHTKLVTLMHSCLKTYDYMVRQERTRLGLEKVLNSTAHVFQNPFLEGFAEGVLLQLTSLFDFEDSAAFVKIEEGAAVYECEQNLRIISSVGSYNFSEQIPETGSLCSNLMQEAFDREEKFVTLNDDHCFLASFVGSNKEHYMLFLRGAFNLFTDLHLKLISIYCHNVLIAFENIFLNNEIEESQSEIVNMLGGAVETRSKETGNHIKRVAILSELLGSELGLNDQLVDFIRLASPLHDVGKIAIPDSILNKPGKLEPDEWELMKTHAEKGYEMLSKCKNRAVLVAANIAYEHHEKWDGSGYPRGIAGEEISIEGRITAVADVFDALCSKRCYKDAWTYDDSFEYMKGHAGSQFDPKLIDIVLAQKDKIIEIYEECRD